MTDSTDNNQNIIDEAVQQFLNAQMQGQELDLNEFVKKYPGCEHQIRKKLKKIQRIDGLFDFLMKADESDYSEPITENDLIGKKLGDFEILNLIGTGGMGAVFLARQISLDREVALKVISDISGSRKTSLERFKREAKVLADISHPNIVPIYDYDEQGPYSYFAMEYVHGISLDKVLASIKNAPPDEKASDVMRKCLAAQTNIYKERAGSAEASKGGIIDTEYIVTISRIIMSIANALDFAHKKGILHRDVKPSNILIASDGTAKLVDFGLAKAESQQTVTVTGEFFGTPSYVSPEQIRKPETVDCRSDVFSLAATYYECLTLHAPFEGNTINETLTQVISREAIPPKKYCPRLSSDFNTVLLHALEKLQDDRYQNANELATDIQNVLDFKPITAKRPSITHRAYKIVRRSPLKTGVIIGVFLISCIFSVLIISNEIKNRKREDARQLFELARNKMTSLNYTEALQYLDNALSKDSDFVEAYIASAECHRFLGNYDKSVQLCKKALSVSHYSSTAQFQLGQALTIIGNWEQARTAFEQSIKIDPNFGWAHAALAACYHNLKMDKDAVEEFRKAIAVDPNVSGKKLIYLGMATTLSSMGQFTEAIKTYEKVIEIDPQEISAYSGISTCYTQLGDEIKAQEASKKAANIDSGNVNTYLQLAQSLLDTKNTVSALELYRSAAERFKNAGKYEEALKLYKAALNVTPYSWSMLIGAGDCYQALKDYKNAISSFQKAASQTNIDSSIAYIKLGNCLKETGKDTDAITAYLLAISKNPNKYLSYATLAMYYESKGLYQEAIEIYKKAEIIDQTNSQIQRDLGGCYMSAGQYSEAVERYEKYLETDLNNYNVLWSTALCYQELNNHKKAIELLEKAIKIQPNEAILHSTIASSYTAIGNHNEALGAYNKALAINPNDAVSWGCLGECYERVGVLEQAIKSYEKSLSLKADSYIGLSNLAFIYATCNDDKLRDGNKSLELAIKACELTGNKSHLCLSSLAAAYAECGDFDKAVEWQQKAIELIPEKEFIGIGINMKKTTEQIEVDSVFPDGPAYKSGIRDGDIFMAIDGQSTKDLSLDTVLNKIAGKAGTEIMLTIRHSGQDKEEVIHITRERIPTPIMTDYTKRLEAYKAKRPWRQN